MTPLPIDPHLPGIVESLRASGALVLVAAPGAGKTTRVPPAIVRAGLLPREHPNLVMLQPRRVAARAAAERIAGENGWRVGDEVGYHVRFDRRIGRDTQIRVMTEGILTRMLLDDPLLDGVGAVLLDEFHERSIHTDLAIALLKEVRAARPELLLVVMSATLDAGPVAAYLGGCRVVAVEGRAYPVETQYSLPSGAFVEDRVAAAVGEAVGRDDAGDVLVFLPGAEEIRRTGRALAALAAERDLLVLPLYGSLPVEEQYRALRPSDRQKVILATNIAETSLTIDGVRTVIDSGLARVAGYDARRGLDRLDVKRISRASATQRAGRAGRTAPGRCVRLWTQREQNELDEFELPEIRRVDLTATLLTLHAWGRPDVQAFAWFEPPDDRALAAGERLLFLLGLTGAAENGRITSRGARAAQLPVHPRLGRLLVDAADAGLGDAGAALAALLGEKDIATFDGRPHERVAATHGRSDLIVRLAMLDRAERERFTPHLRDAGIDPEAARQVARVRDELARAIGRGGRSPSSSVPIQDGERRGERQTRMSVPREGETRMSVPREETSADDALLRLVLSAYPDRVCRRRGSDASAGVMVGGAGVRVANESVVRTAAFFVAADARADDRARAGEALVRVASAVEPAWLEAMFPQSVARERTLSFDAGKRRVVARGTVRYLDLVLREDADAAVDATEAGPVLAAALRPEARAWFAGDGPAANLMARVGLLREHMPEHAWPAFDDAELGDVLAAACEGRRSADEVRRVPPAALLEARLPYPLDRLLEQHAPATVAVPTGSRIKVEYAPGQPPTLAVRLQELFGWTDTPRVAGGRVPVVLHLLGPNYRPVQVTSDLRSFWAGAYFQVRKDLKARYPKHAWPEDPLSATPERRGRSTR